MHPLKDVWNDKNDARNGALLVFLIIIAAILIYLDAKSKGEPTKFGIFL